MTIFGRAGGLFSRKHVPPKPRTLSGVTFDGLPFSVQLASDTAVGHGAWASIYDGYSYGGPWNEPLLVAVKVPGQMLKPAQQEVLLREMRTASQVSLRHQRILEFLGTVDVGDQKSLVSRYMPNGNLLEYLKSHPQYDKQRLIIQVAEGVEYLHMHAGLVHGDLKCENVLISDSGDALLADFGLSTFVEKSQFDATTTTSIRDMNTIRFAAPELLQGSDDLTVRPRSKTVESDVYAFGMLILQAVTELPPWSNLNTMAVMQSVCQRKRPPQPASNAQVTISHSWWDVCRSCWSHAPGHRPAMNTVLGRLRSTGLDPRREFEGCGSAILSIACVPGGSRVVTCSIDGKIRVLDTFTGRTVIGPVRGHDGTVYSLAVSPDGGQISSCGTDHTIRRWDADSGSPIGKPMIGHSDEVNSVAFSPDGTRIASGSDDRTVRLWDATTGEALGRPLAGHTNWVRAVAFSPDGACIASGSRDGTMRLWDSTTGTDLGVVHHTGLEVSAVCFSHDRIHLVSGSNDGVIRIWNISTLELERNIKVATRLVALSPSGRYIAGSSEESIRIWDVQTGDAVGAPLTRRTRWISSIAFFPDKWISSIAFSPDGRTLVSGLRDGTLHIWDLFE